MEIYLFQIIDKFEIPKDFNGAGVFHSAQRFSFQPHGLFTLVYSETV